MLPEKVRALLAEFGDSLLLVSFYTSHVLNHNEAVGKSSNTAWAVRCVKHQLVDVWGFDVEDVLLTICDADTYFDLIYGLPSISPCAGSNSIQYHIPRC